MQRAPGIPCALLLFERDNGSQNSGELRRENAGLCLGRHCEERSDEAIQNVDAVRLWIASLALAMTTLREAHPTLPALPRRRYCFGPFPLFPNEPRKIPVEHRGFFLDPVITKNKPFRET